MDRPEAELLTRTRAGDPDAFGELVTRYRAAAYRVALGLLVCREQALDLTQEAFARVYLSRRNLDPQRPFFPYLYRVLRNLCLNALRDTRTRAQRLEQASRVFLLREPEEDPARLAELEEERRLCGAALATLPTREREVVLLQTFEGLKYREIADLLDVPLGTVMSRLYSARRRLAIALEGQI